MNSVLKWSIAMIITGVATGLMFLGLSCAIHHNYLEKGSDNMMINIEAPACPNCDDDLYAYTYDDIETLPDGDIIISQIGECQRCKSHYRWKEFYSYKGYTDVKSEGKK